MPPKTKEEMKEYNRHLYLKRKERKQNAVVSVSLSEPKSPIELVITELPMPVPVPFQPPIQIQSNTISNMEDIMRELMMELFEEEETQIEDEIIEGTIKSINFRKCIKKNCRMTIVFGSNVGEKSIKKSMKIIFNTKN